MTSSFRIYPLLKRVARSFYLSLKVLPPQMAENLALSYLLARLADTLSDSLNIPASERMKAMLSLRAALILEGTSSEIESGKIAIFQSFAQHCPDPDEAQLLLESGKLLQYFHSKTWDHERASMRELLLELSRAMEWDLKIEEKNEHLKTKIQALNTFNDTEVYTYWAAGCVGRYWTELAFQKLPRCRQWNHSKMLEAGIHLGKGLQWTNILRDISKDLKKGRSYLSSEDLARYNLSVDDLANPKHFARITELILEATEHAREHLKHGVYYLEGIPKSETRLRLSVCWPLCLALDTLDLIREAPLSVLDPQLSPPKVSRNEVYKMLARTSCLAKLPGLKLENFVSARFNDYAASNS